MTSCIGCLKCKDIAMDVADFDFDLPESLIAQEPAAERGGSRLLVLHRDGAIEHAMFADLPHYLVAGDLLVVNNTRAFPARLLGHRIPSGGAVECMLLSQLPTPNSQLPRSAEWDALMHPGQKLRPGAHVVFERDGIRIDGEILAMHFQGRRTIRLTTDHPAGLADAIDRVGHIPLPPYIKRPDADADKDRYQTVYARERGSIAAPTAGLHFTSALLASLIERGVERAEITLQVGYGTFKPVKSEHVEDHVVDAEHFSVSPDAASMLTRATRRGHRIIAVGTTTVRTLESLDVTADAEVLPRGGETNLFIKPGHKFQLVDGMVTNFHLPKSSLLMLVCAFAGRERVLAAYREAVQAGYRFYSYGDAMLIL
jgi:S-adenosylmethionine:tRNA ribosyltransferase-isomerase